MRYGWTWFLPEDDPDKRGTAWIEVGQLDDQDCMSGDAICEIICRNYKQVQTEHPEWITAKEQQAKTLVNALNLCVLIVNDCPITTAGETNLCRFCGRTWAEEEYVVWKTNEDHGFPYPPEAGGGLPRQKWNHHDHDCLWVIASQTVGS